MTLLHIFTSNIKPPNLSYLPFLPISTSTHFLLKKVQNTLSSHRKHTPPTPPLCENTHHIPPEHYLHPPLPTLHLYTPPTSKKHPKNIKKCYQKYDIHPQTEHFYPTSLQLLLYSPSINTLSNTFTPIFKPPTSCYTPPLLYLQTRSFLLKNTLKIPKIPQPHIENTLPLPPHYVNTLTTYPLNTFLTIPHLPSHPLTLSYSKISP